jgi:hypothetical protein
VIFNVPPPVLFINDEPVPLTCPLIVNGVPALIVIVAPVNTYVEPAVKSDPLPNSNTLALLILCAPLNDLPVTIVFPPLCAKTPTYTLLSPYKFNVPAPVLFISPDVPLTCPFIKKSPPDLIVIVAALNIYVDPPVIDDPVSKIKLLPPLSLCAPPNDAADTVVTPKLCANVPKYPLLFPAITSTAAPVLFIKAFPSLFTCPLNVKFPLAALMASVEALKSKLAFGENDDPVSNSNTVPFLILCSPLNDAAFTTVFPALCVNVPL